MKKLLCLFLWLSLTLLVRADYSPAMPTNAVDSALYDWHDAARGRDVPVKIYFPKNISGKFPVIIFSPGLGGTREGYEYLGVYWASHGYISLHLQHVGTDRSVFKHFGPLDLKSAMLRALTDPQNTINRAKDVTFAIDQLQKLNADDAKLKGKMDLSRIGMAGHSFGAGTSLVIVGQQVPGQTLADARISAAVVMSPPMLAGTTPVYAVKVPVCFMTGTKDVGFTTPAERRMAYDKISSDGTCFINFKDANHMTFAGQPGPLGRDENKKFKPLICVASEAFWDAHLKGNTDAKKWLERGGFEKFLGDDGKFELK